MKDATVWQGGRGPVGDAVALARMDFDGLLSLSPTFHLGGLFSFSSLRLSLPTF